MRMYKETGIAVPEKIEYNLQTRKNKRKPE
jgi:hypothetical protein